MLPARRVRLVDPSSLASFALLAGVGFMLTAVPLRSSHDEWWHLKTGRWIDEHGLPANDVFTYTAENIPWHNHEWLAQWLLWRVYKIGELGGVGGVRAVIFAKAAFLTATFLAVAFSMARATGAPGLAALAAALALALSRRTLYPRPPFVTYGLLAFTLCFLIAWRAKRLRSAWLIVLPPLFALWANLHGGFMAGLVVVGAFWGESLVAWGLAHWRLEEPRPALRSLAWVTAVLALCALATLATPYGLHLYQLAGRVMTDERLAGTIFELLPPNWRYVWALDGCMVVMLFAAARPRSLRALFLTAAFGGFLFYFLQGWVLYTAWAGQSDSVTSGWELGVREAAAFVIFLVAAARSKESVGLAQTLLLLFFTHQGIRHVRHLPLAAIMLAPVMAQTLADWLRGTVGGWDWIWRINDAAEAAPEYLATLRLRRLRLGHRAGLILLAGLAAFYALLPEEALRLVMSASSGVPLNKRSRQTLLDRNLALLRDAAYEPTRDRGTEPGAYPKAAAQFLIESGLPGRLWNGGNYAGYLIWRLSPEKYKLFTDNRYDIYGGAFIQQERIVLQAFEGDAARSLPSWREVLREWEVRTLFIPVDAPIQKVLSEEEKRGSESAWRQVWNDGQFAIWTFGPAPPLPR